MIPGFAVYESLNLSSEGPTNLLSVFDVQHMESYKAMQIPLHYFLKVHLALGELESTKFSKTFPIFSCHGNTLLACPNKK